MTPVLLRSHSRATLLAHSCCYHSIHTRWVVLAAHWHLAPHLVWLPTPWRFNIWSHSSTFVLNLPKNITFSRLMAFVPTLLINNPLDSWLDLLLKSTLKSYSVQRSDNRSFICRAEVSKGSQTSFSTCLDQYIGEINRWEGFLTRENGQNSNRDQPTHYLGKWDKKWKEICAEWSLRTVWLTC